MGELKRKGEELSTADLLGRNEERRLDEQEMEDPNQPKPVRGVVTEFRDDKRDAANVSTGLKDSRSTDATAATPLFSESDIGDLRGRWSNVQAGFVDEPRKAVQEADNLVASVMKRLAEGFAKERSTLERQWDSGDNVSTEDLRVALQRYRSFFDRLLNA